jgi:hypothetical protein
MNDTAANFTQNPARALVGVHISFNTLQGLVGLGLEHTFLAHILIGALRRRSLLVEAGHAGPDSAFFNALGKIKMFAYERQVFGIIPVTNIDLAFATIFHELTAIELISGAHIAATSGESGWRTLCPIPEPMPWGKHLDDFNAWAAETPEQRRARLIQFARSSYEILEDLGNREAAAAPQSPKNDDPAP